MTRDFFAWRVCENTRDYAGTGENTREPIPQAGTRRDCPARARHERRTCPRTVAEPIRHRRGRSDAAQANGERLPNLSEPVRRHERRTVAPVTCPAQAANLSGRPSGGRSPRAAHRNGTDGAARSGRARTRPAQGNARAGGCGAFPANLSANRCHGCRLSGEPVRRDRNRHGKPERGNGCGGIGNGCGGLGNGCGELLRQIATA